MRFSGTIHHMFENRTIQQITREGRSLDTPGRNSNFRRNTDESTGQYAFQGWRLLKLVE